MYILWIGFCLKSIDTLIQARLFQYVVCVCSIFIICFVVSFITRLKVHVLSSFLFAPFQFFASKNGLSSHLFNAPLSFSIVCTHKKINGSFVSVHFYSVLHSKSIDSFVDCATNKPTNFVLWRCK